MLSKVYKPGDLVYLKKMDENNGSKDILVHTIVEYCELHGDTWNYYVKGISYGIWDTQCLCSYLPHIKELKRV